MTSKVHLEQEVGGLACGRKGDGWTRAARTLQEFWASLNSERCKACERKVRRAQ
jgi:hypothetical protein